MSCLRSGRGGKVSSVAKVDFDIAPTGGSCARFPLSDMLWISKLHTLDTGERRRVDAFDTKQVEKMGSVEVLLKTQRLNDKSGDI